MAFDSVARGLHAGCTLICRAIATGLQVGGITKGPGETFGVASLVLGEPTRAYGMVAVERSVFLVVSQENFEPFMHTHPKVEPSIMLMTKRFLLQVNALGWLCDFHPLAI